MDVVREVALILYKSDPNADKGGKKGVKKSQHFADIISGSSLKYLTVKTDALPDEAEELWVLDELLDDVADVEETLDVVVRGEVERRTLLQEGHQVARQAQHL